MSLRTWLSILLPDDNLAKMADCISFSRCFTMTSQAFHSLITCWYLAVIFSSIYKTNIAQWKNCSWLKRNTLLHSYSVFFIKNEFLPEPYLFCPSQTCSVPAETATPLFWSYAPPLHNKPTSAAPAPYSSGKRESETDGDSGTTAAYGTCHGPLVPSSD